MLWGEIIGSPGDISELCSALEIKICSFVARSKSNHPIARGSQDERNARISLVLRGSIEENDSSPVAILAQPRSPQSENPGDKQFHFSARRSRGPRQDPPSHKKKVAVKEEKGPQELQIGATGDRTLSCRSTSVKSRLPQKGKAHYSDPSKRKGKGRGTLGEGEEHRTDRGKSPEQVPTLLKHMEAKVEEARTPR